MCSNDVIFLINNAGQCYRDVAESVNLTHLDDMMRTHVRAAAHLTKLFMPHLIETKGSIVNVSSIFGKRPVS